MTSKRELIAPNGDKRLIRRDAKGRIKEATIWASRSARTSRNLPRPWRNQVKVIAGTRSANRAR